MANIGKNKRKQLLQFDAAHNVTLSVDSKEECDFIEWLNEAKELSIINDFQYQPSSFLLSDNVKYINVFNKSKTLFREHAYSTDFLIKFNPNKYKDLAAEFKVSQDNLSCQECSVYIDVKGTFNRNTRSFSTDRKWVWQKFNIYIYELIPVKFFKLFGCPQKCKFTNKTKKPRKLFQGFKMIFDIFKS